MILVLAMAAFALAPNSPNRLVIPFLSSLAFAVAWVVVFATAFPVRFLKFCAAVFALSIALGDEWRL